MRVAYWKTEDCSLNQLVVDLSLSAHLPSRLTWRVRPYCLEPVWLGSRDSGICWAGSLPKQQPESLPLQRSLSLYIYIYIYICIYIYIYTYSRFTRDGADVGAGANTVAAASGRSRIFERGQVLKAWGSRRHRRRGSMESERGSAPPQKYFKKILILT